MLSGKDINLTRNRSLSVRSKKDNASSAGSEKSAPKHRFTMASLRGMQQPELSKKLFKMIKSENHTIGAYESASRERISIASQLSDWGEATGDDAISDISDKLGVLLSVGLLRINSNRSVEELTRTSTGARRARRCLCTEPRGLQEHPQADPQYRKLGPAKQRPQG